MSGLPIEAALPALLEALISQNMAVLQAPPGAGKTTRVPLALLETGLFEGKILMLEPRRLAARSAAARLAEQLGEDVGASVGFAMRGENTTHKGSRIDVVTEGVLTRILQSDPELSGISCIIFDEFHERSLQADLGLALALEVRDALRPDLCLMPMSATLDAAPVAALMGDAPIVTSEGRSFPVEERFLPRPWKQPNQRGVRFETALADLVVQAAGETEGSILAFLPGAGEINRTADLLRGRLGKEIDIRPLYGAMRFADQRAAIAPSKRRKVVLATSIAETSLTIEGITVVVDGGLARRAEFDAGRGMSRLITTRVSKAEATQRAGRAGRLSPGVCYKLWSAGENGGLSPFAEPEILRSDMAGLALELARWGSSDPASLPFLTAPRESDYAAACDLLRDLGALDARGQLTELGAKVAKTPVHPRLGVLLSRSGGDAAVTAAILEGQDPLRRGAIPLPSDLRLRVEAVRDPKKFAKDHPFAVDHAGVSRIKDTAKRLRPQGETRSLGQMAALAYPDRVAMRRQGDAPRFLLANGAGAELDMGDPLAGARLIVATDLDGARKDARIRLAAEITEAELVALYPDRIKEVWVCRWSKRRRAVLARVQRQFGALVLSDQNWPDCPPQERAKALLDGIRDLGLSVLPWDKHSTALQRRIEWARGSGLDLPDCSNDGLMADAEAWLLPYLDGIKSIEGLAQVKLKEALWARLDWAGQTALNEAAPESLRVPTGTNVLIDYSAEQPKIAVRLQEVFGMTAHPTLGKSREPLKIELLSPARRPVQTTSDLPNFWATSYADVRKDMRGRYPKHPWPENPAEAQATRRVKPKP